MKTNSIKAALLAAIAVPAVAVAADFYYKSDGDSGSFESPANWYVGNAIQLVYPGEDDAICCTTGLKTIRFETSGTTHRVARVSLDKTTGDNQRLLVDLNGGDLYVTDVVKMRASRYEGIVQPYLGVTNGTLHAQSGIFCGEGDYNCRGAFDAFGPDTHVVVGTGNLLANGAYSEINIGGGASVSWEGPGFLRLANGRDADGQIFSTEKTLAKINIVGAGTTLECTNGFTICNNARLRIADKAVVNISGFSTLGLWGRQNRNPIGVDDGGPSGTSGAAIEVDDATFSITNGFNVMLAEPDRNPLRNHSITVKNGGTFNYSGNTSFYLAYIASHDNGVYKSATNNCLRVYSGARFSSDGNEVTSEWSGIGSIMVGGAGNCYDNGIHVSNGVISVTHIALAGHAMASNNWLRIEGRTSRVLLNQKYGEAGNLSNNYRAPALGIHNNARVEFVLGPDGFDNVPIELTTAIGRVDGRQGEGQKAQIIVEDQGFARNHANETITLIKTLNDKNRSFLGQLAENAVVVAARDSHKGAFSVSEDGKSLLYTAPRKSGMMLIFR